MQNKYPNIHVRSKNELIKRLGNGSKKMSKETTAELVNDVLANFDAYWRDHPSLSRPQDNKWVRDASYTRLGELLRHVNTVILAPHDEMIPDFLFGGITGRSHKAAVKHLLGRKRGRVLLKLDISRFYERISQERVEHFFAAKAGCGTDGSRILASLCCVPYGPKGEPSSDLRTIARGFSTSSRLAVWCNIDVFNKIDRVVRRNLKGKDPRVAIYVDDIGITASRVTKEEMMRLYPKIKRILDDAGLPLNELKTKIIFHSGETYDISGEYKGKWSFEHLGIQMNRNSLSLGMRTRWKKATLDYQMKKNKGRHMGVKRARKALAKYRGYIEKS